MKQFNYKKAFDEAAFPAYEALSPYVKNVFEEVINQASDLSQSKDLSMPWPKTPLMELFGGLNDFDVAVASKVIYSAGHWAYAEFDLAFEAGGSAYQLRNKLQNHGSYWKFSNYADQILRERLGVEYRPNYNRDNLRNFEIHVGMIRICVQTPDSWNWIDLALATRENMEMLRDVSFPSHTDFPNRNVYSVTNNGWEKYSTAVIDVAKMYVEKHTGELEKIIDAKYFMEYIDKL